MVQACVVQVARSVRAVVPSGPSALLRIVRFTNETRPARKEAGVSREHDVLRSVNPMRVFDRALDALGIVGTRKIVDYATVETCGLQNDVDLVDHATVAACGPRQQREVRLDSVVAFSSTKCVELLPEIQWPKNKKVKIRWRILQQVRSGF